MRRFGRIALIALVIVVAPLAVGAVLLDQRYEVVRRSPFVAHDRFASEGDTIRLALQPALAGEFLTMAGELDYPGVRWLVGEVLPRETALFIDADFDAKQTLVRVFVNEQRLGPLIEESADVDRMGEILSFVDWSSGLERREPGIILAEGTAEISPELAALTNAAGTPRPFEDLPRFEGGHLIEAVMDNRGGAALIALLSMHCVHAEEPLLYDPASMWVYLEPIESIRLVGDPVSETDIELNLRITCREDVTDEETVRLARLLDSLCKRFKGDLFNATRIRLQDEIAREDNHIDWTLTLRELDRTMAELTGTDN